MDGTGGRLLPIYLVIDVSTSMSGPGMLEAANAIMPAVVEALARNPVLSDRVRFGLIDFADTASVRLPLCDLLGRDVALPRLSARAGTNFAAALSLLAQQIGVDVARLRADGTAVHRPVAWFLSGGVPEENPATREAALARLASAPVAPDIIACGIDQAQPDVMAALVHPPGGPGRMPLYMMQPGCEPAKAVTALAEVLISSMIQSGYSLGPGGTATTLPDPADLPPGIHQLDTGTWTER